MKRSHQADLQHVGNLDCTACSAAAAARGHLRDKGGLLWDADGVNPEGNNVFVIECCNKSMTLPTLRRECLG